MKYFLNYYEGENELTSGLTLQNKKEVDYILKHKDDLSAVITHIKYCKVYINGERGKETVVTL